MRQLLGLALLGAGLYAAAVAILEEATRPPSNIPSPLAPGHTEL